MDTIQGIQFENDANGIRQYIKIDLEKYGNQLKPFLKKIGIVDAKDIFDLEWKNAVSSEEAKQISINKIKSWWTK